MAEEKTLTLHERLAEVQAELNAPKNRRNTFGNYNYRSAEDILDAVKPILKKHRLTLIVSDELVNIGNRYYVKATARVNLSEAVPTSEFESADGYAREEEEKKGMDGSQITGTASSYARKYALDGLFLIDDTKDADTDEHHAQTTTAPAASRSAASPASAPAKASASGEDVKCEIPSCNNVVWASKVEASKKYNKGHVICYFHSTNGNWEEQLEREVYEMEQEDVLEACDLVDADSRS